MRKKNTIRPSWVYSAASLCARWGVVSTLKWPEASSDSDQRRKQEVRPSEIQQTLLLISRAKSWGLLGSSENQICPGEGSREYHPNIQGSCNKR